MKLAYIIGTYPVLTTTFIDREIQLLRAWGVSLQVIAIRKPKAAISDEQKELQKGVSYLLPVNILRLLFGQIFFAFAKPAAYFGLLLNLLRRPHPDRKAVWMTVLHFGEGVYAAQTMKPHGFSHIHAHFADRAATVALVASRLLGIPYSLTAHAADIYVKPTLLPEKIKYASFVATCTGYNLAHLATLVEGDERRKLKCIYHGLDTTPYQAMPRFSEQKVRLVAVGQLKEKKGFNHLLIACRGLKDQGFDFDCAIIGEGPLRSALEEQIRELQIEDEVVLCGALPHQQVIEKYRQASIFVLPAVLGADGDRDGIPNVILEALAMQLPVVSTAHSGIPEVIEDGVNGLLVAPTDTDALTHALARLISAPDLRKRLGENGRQVVLEKFDLERNVGLLLKEFQLVSEGL